MVIKKALVGDAVAILELQKLAFVSEAEIYNECNISLLKQTLEEITEEFSKQYFLKAVTNGKIVGSVKATEEDGTCFVGRLIVDPTIQN